MSKELLEEIYANHHRDAYLWSRQCMSNSEEEAKDVLQSVYLKVLTGKAKFSGKSSLKTWLFSVIKYTALDYFRRNKKVESLEMVHNVTVNDNESHLDIDYYANTLKQLTDKQTQVLLLVFYHDYTLEAAAEVMGVSIGTARTHYDRGKKKLRKILEQEKQAVYVKTK